MFWSKSRRLWWNFRLLYLKSNVLATISDFKVFGQNLKNGGCKEGFGQNIENVGKNI